MLAGLTATAGVCALWGLGGLRLLDDINFDAHFRYFSTVPASDEIVVVEINDQAIERAGDWPWPRRYFAQIIDVLHELGAGAIVLDIAFVEPAAPRTADPELGRHYDIDTEVPILGSGNVSPIFDDVELAAAASRAGNVYLPMLSRIALPAQRRFDGEAARESCREEPGFEGMVDRLTRAFSLSESDMASLPDQLVDRCLPSAKEDAAKRLAQQFVRTLNLESQENRARELSTGWQRFVTEVLGEHAVVHLSRDREDLLNAFRLAVAQREVLARLPELPAGLAGRIPRATQTRFPIDRIAPALAGVGYVSYDRDRLYGVVRSLPLVVQVEDRIAPLLGFSAAADRRGIDLGELSLDSGHLMWSTEDDGATRLQITDEGLIRVAWCQPTAEHAQDGFQHVAASRLLEIAHNRQTVIENRQRELHHFRALMEFTHRDNAAKQKEYGRWMSALSDAVAGQAMAFSERSRRDLLAQAEKAWDHLTTEHAKALDHLRWLRKQAAETESDAAPPDDLDALIGRLVSAYLGEHGQAELLADANAELAARTDRLKAAVGPLIRGRICLVGYTATGTADLVATPVSASMAGVSVHANVANMILQRRYVTMATPSVGLGMLIFGGVFSSILSNVRTPRFGAFVLGLASVGLLAGGALVFSYATIHVPTGQAVLVIVVAWGVATLYRLLVEERSRRTLQRALAQYTSPGVATQIAESLRTPDLTPQPAEVTCFLSDLRGFTAISERLGPDQTRRVLNPYLRGVSEVLVAQGAMVNKFLGDGIFAFFNAPIWPCPQREAQACASALAALKVIDDINGSNVLPQGSAPLAVRIGISTGPAFVGDYGGERKLDYTCIGDPANLCQRLQEACKVLGVSIAVDRATRERVEAPYVFRHLGAFLLPGRSEPADLYELCGVDDELSRDGVDYASRFSQFVSRVQGGDAGAARAEIESLRLLRPADPLLVLYEQLFNATARADGSSTNAVLTLR